MDLLILGLLTISNIVFLLSRNYNKIIIEDKCNLLHKLFCLYSMDKMTYKVRIFWDTNF